MTDTPPPPPETPILLLLFAAFACAVLTGVGLYRGSRGVAGSRSGHAGLTTLALVPSLFFAPADTGTPDDRRICALTPVNARPAAFLQDSIPKRLQA
jgi:hypothetical protein